MDPALNGFIVGVLISLGCCVANRGRWSVEMILGWAICFFAAGVARFS